MYLKIKNLVIKYIDSVDINQETELKIQEMKSDTELFKERHLIIQQLQSDVEASTKKIANIKSEIEKIREEIVLNENYIKKKTIENNNLKKQNEKILFSNCPPRYPRTSGAGAAGQEHKGCKGSR